MFFEKGDNTMAKTKEELDALKEELKTVKEEIKSLSEEELKSVAGGDDETDCTPLHCPMCNSTDTGPTRNPRYHWICHTCGYVW